MSGSPSPSIQPTRSPGGLLTGRVFRLGLRAHSFVRHRALPAAQSFVATEASGGLVIFGASLAALVWANSALDADYFDLWKTKISIDASVFSLAMDLRHWVNDGLMALFFFVAGLEIKRELMHGELRTWRRAAMPVIAAAGGMALPALIYLGFTLNGRAGHGWGVPMATDIAFALGLLALAGSSVPFGLKVFVLALAIVDDLGSILVIALFYSGSIHVTAMAVAAVVLATTVILKQAGSRSLVLYGALAVAFWVALAEAGVTPTLAGVAFGLLTPAGPRYDGDDLATNAPEIIAIYAGARATEPDARENALLQLEDLVHGSEAPLERIERAFHPWVSFGVLPLFALANVGVSISSHTLSDAFHSPVFQGVLLARLLGKPAGIFLATYLAVRAGVGELPSGAGLMQILGAGVVASVGFTVSLLVADLAFDYESLTDFAKLALLIASVAAAVVGYAILRLAGGKPRREA